MASSMPWNPSASREVRTTARPKWEQIRQGLGLAVLGHLCFIILAVPPLVLALPLRASIPRLTGLHIEDATLLAWALAGLGALLGYVMVLLGQWRCLVHAHQGHGAKELQFACLLCAIVAPPCLVTGYFLGGMENYSTLERGLHSLTDVLNVLRGGGAFLFAGVLILIFNVLLFTGFARAVRRSLGEPDDSMITYVWSVAFLLGLTAGYIMNAQYFAHHRAWPLLALSWLLGLLWHALLLHGTAQAVVESRRGSGLVPALSGPHSTGGQVTLRAAAFLPGYDQKA